VSVPLVLVHPFFGGKDYGRLAILGLTNDLVCFVTWRNEWFFNTILDRVSIHAERTVKMIVWDRELSRFHDVHLHP
jgi:hydrogenase maturation factor